MNDEAAIPGIDVERVTAWFAEHAGATPPLRFELIAGGRSNLTYSVTDAEGRRWALRRPPLGHVLATAHDMGREHRIISALADTDVPVAPVVGLETDDAVNGAPFYVMDFVDGIVVRDAWVAETLSVEQRAAIGRSIAATLAKIHAVDPDAVDVDAVGRCRDVLRINCLLINCLGHGRSWLSAPVAQPTNLVARPTLGAWPTSPMPPSRPM